MIIRRLIKGLGHQMPKYHMSSFPMAPINLEQEDFRISNPDISPIKNILKPIQLQNSTSVTHLAQLLEVDSKELIKTFKMFHTDPINYSMLSQDQIEPILALYDAYLNKDNLVSRPPVVTIMGHVDHGKTTLLDRLRNSQIANGEVGGITQKIGAFHVQVGDAMVTFIDTPGHEAFSNMRVRGATFTDMIILVVSAIDGVQPQTKEVIQIAHNLQIPIIVAVNKIDVVGANPEEVEMELIKCKLDLESDGGNVPVVHVSALTGKNLDLLLELIMFQTELMNLQADPNKLAQGVVLEARQHVVEQDKTERGSTLIIQKGTLHVGDIIVVGEQYAKVRAIRDDRNKLLQQATPSQAVEIVGLKEVPDAGDKFFVTSELMAKLLVQKRIQERKTTEYQNQVQIDGSQGKLDSMHNREKKRLYADERLLRAKFHEAQEQLLQEIQETEDQETIVELSNRLESHKLFADEMVFDTTSTGMNLILKGQDFGTLETMKGLVERTVKDQSTDQFQISVIGSGVGEITMKDIKEAKLFDASILAMNVQLTNDLVKLAKSLGVAIHQHQIIYSLIDQLKKLIQLQKVGKKVSVLGNGKVMNVFEIKLGKLGARKVFGVQVTKGAINKKHFVRVLRNGQVVFKDLEIINLKYFKVEAQVIEQGKECGLQLVANVDIKAGDEVETYQK